MKCPLCGRDVRKLTYRREETGCDSCLSIRDSGASMGILHQRAGNQYAPKMTVAEKLNITTRETRPDGRNRPAPRWASRIGY